METKVETLKTETSKTRVSSCKHQKTKTTVSTQLEVTWFHWTKWPCWRLFSGFAVEFASCLPAESLSPASP